MILQYYTTISALLYNYYSNEIFERCIRVFYKTINFKYTINIDLVGIFSSLLFIIHMMKFFLYE